MDSKQFEGQEAYTIGPVVFRAKKKSCGKPQCAKCPHGPFHYAYLTFNEAKSEKREEVYFGAKWNAADLRAKLLPRLKDWAAGDVRKAIEAVERSEAIARLQGDLTAIERNMEYDRNQYVRHAAAMAAERDRIKSELRRLGAKRARTGKKAAPAPAALASRRRGRRKAK